MSAGAEMLGAGWVALLNHHETPITYMPRGAGVLISLQALVSKPSDVAEFGNQNLGVAYVLFVTVGAAPYAVDDTVIMDGLHYRVLQVERQAANISVRLLLGVTSIAGKQ